MNGEILKKKQSKTLKDLRNDVFEYQTTVIDTVSGDKRKIQTSLARDKNLRITYQNVVPQVNFSFFFYK